jgi:hypothetical protein
VSENYEPQVGECPKTMYLIQVGHFSIRSKCNFSSMWVAKLSFRENMKKITLIGSNKEISSTTSSSL